MGTATMETLLIKISEVAVVVVVIEAVVTKAAVVVAVAEETSKEATMTGNATRTRRGEDLGQDQAPVPVQAVPHLRKEREERTRKETRRTRRTRKTRNTREKTRILPEKNTKKI